MYGIGDLYPHYVWQAEGIEDRTIPFDSRAFLVGLRYDDVTAAKDRIKGFLFEILGLY
ncbi:hypothetical protein V1508DRAFT_233393 [Lipomyces doorenjongii]|uniref:uncharacterized protein n=1 Tax=Lipomyces doorenjongii TaxID=383834 RepID=UPI0034CD741C